ncbi:MAG: hypothetical protein H0V67_12015 [Geodermatophilaceae bacterium]|nr:hypothetical protein [Geodermatophilaceae bacterium]
MLSLIGFRPLAVLVAAVAVVSTVSVIAPQTAAAAPVPAAPAFGSIIDPYSEYQSESSCDPTDKPGPLALRDLLVDTYGPATVYISRTCSSGGSSGHYQGRAMDWMQDINDPTDRDEVETFLDWLLATDQYGNRNAMLRRMGIMYLIWNREIWEAYDSTPSWQPYSGSSPHTDHVHISFGWDGAYKRTTYWNPSASYPAVPLCPAPPVQPAPPAVNYGSGLGYVPVTPTRLLDTRRSGAGVPARCRVAAGGRLDIKVAGVAGVPASGVGAVVVNLTGVSPDTATWLGAYPAGTTWPGNSSVSIVRSAISATLVVVPVGSNGMISLRNGGGRTDALVDIVGYHPLSAGTLYTSTTPRRALDTRAAGGRFAGRETRTVALGQAPANATGVIVNLASVDPSASGYVTVSAGGSGATGGTSALNMTLGRVVSNRAYVALGANATLDIHTSAASDVLVDVVGWFGPTGSRFMPLTPTRSFDSRNDIGGLVRFTGGAAQELDLLAAGVPAAATSVVMTLTTTQVSTSTYVTAWPHARPRPPTSDLNVVPNADTSNLVVSELGAGSLDVVIGHGRADLVGDVVGYFR